MLHKCESMRFLDVILGDEFTQHEMTITPCHTALRERERPGPFCHHLSDDHCLMIGDLSHLAGSVSLPHSAAGSGG